MSKEIHEDIWLECKKNFNKNRENKPYRKNMYIFALEVVLRDVKEASSEYHYIRHHANR